MGVTTEGVEDEGPAVGDGVGDVSGALARVRNAMGAMVEDGEDDELAAGALENQSGGKTKLAKKTKMVGKTTLAEVTSFSTNLISSPRSANSKDKQQFAFFEN